MFRGRYRLDEVLTLSVGHGSILGPDVCVHKKSMSFAPADAHVERAAVPRTWRELELLAKRSAGPTMITWGVSVEPTYTRKEVVFCCSTKFVAVSVNTYSTSDNSSELGIVTML